MSELYSALLRLGPQLAEHVILSACAVGLGLIIALPLAGWAGRTPIVAKIALGAASLIQTIPALALLALFFPILLAARSIFGENLPTLGFLPALLALALYALLPILRNAVTAITNIDPQIIEAADGLGMTPAQKLRLVEAPICAPFIMAGIRTASVWTIGAATLATTIGQPSLGDPIFAGLQTQNWILVLAGCVASAGLALTADALLGLIERGFKLRQPKLSITAGLIAILGIAIAAISLTNWGSQDRRETITIGAKAFSEQFILARVIGAKLEEAGYRVEYREGLGSAVVHEALTTSAIDISIDYTGTLWTNAMDRSDNPGRAEMLAEITAWEQETSGTKVLGKLGFENAYGFAMRKDRAAELEITDLNELGYFAPDLIAGGDPEFFERPEWHNVRNAYNLRFEKTRNFTATFIYNALQSGEADVISAYTSDGRIAADDLLVLDDPLGSLPSYDAIVLLSPRIAQDARLAKAIEPLLGAIDVETMREANYSVDRSEDKRTAQQAADWLLDQIKPKS